MLGYDEWLEGLERGVAAHHAGLVPVFRETVEECFEAGLLKVVFATETLSLGINMPARSVVIERFTKYGGAGRATLTSGEYLQLTGRAGRRGLDEEGHAVVAWSNETTFAEAARVASAPPPDLRSAFRPTYNLAVNLVSRFDRETAAEVLQRSFAQWQARHARPPLQTAGPPGGRARAAGLPRRAGALTPAGRRLSRIYHEADLLIAEALGGGVLAGAEPAVVAGVLSAVVFEPRRARRVPGHQAPRRAGNSRGHLQDRLGDKRPAELAWRCEALGVLAERVRAVEEAHLVPRTRQPAPGLATAVASWARGASFATALGVAARDVGELAPGDFVRTMKSVADLAQQVSHTADDTEVAAAAREAVGLCSGASWPGACRGLNPSATAASPSFYGWPGMFPYAEERFTADEETVLRRYVTNLDKPVFALVNLPEVVKGALFARYSRSPKSLRRLFLDEFVGDLDISGDATRRRDGRAGASGAALREGLRRVRRRLCRTTRAACTSPASSRPTCCRRCSSGGASCPTWSSRPATSRTTSGSTTGSTATTGRPRSLTPRTGPVSSARWTACSTPTARCCPHAGLGGRAVPPAVRRQRLRLPPGHPGQVARRATRAPAGRLAVEHRHLRQGQSYEQLLLRMRAHPLPEARPLRRHDAASSCAR